MEGGLKNGRAPEEDGVPGLTASTWPPRREIAGVFAVLGPSDPLPDRLVGSILDVCERTSRTRRSATQEPTLSPSFDQSLEDRLSTLERAVRQLLSHAGLD